MTNSEQQRDADPMREYRALQAREAVAVAAAKARAEWWERLRREAPPAFSRLPSDDTEGGEQ